MRLKSSYSLNSFKLFVVAGAFCLADRKMPQKHSLLEHRHEYYSLNSGGEVVK